jgi:WD40 repeat protein
MIFTFYSYKGGVGRSMALANIAELFFKRGLRVLIVDWDLEAPGLERFFSVELETILDKPGVIDLLMNYKYQMSQEVFVKNGEDLPFEKPKKYITDIYPKSGKGKLYLLTAGRRSDDQFSRYANNVLTFDWHDFYLNWEGELYLDWIRREFEKIADVVLIDSRTGVNEMGGVCTYQLADVVVMFCAMNQQNIDGTRIMAQNFTNPELSESRANRDLKIIIVPSRVEDRAEIKDLRIYQKEFVEKFDKFMPASLAPRLRSFWDLKIPHVPYYAFNETIAVSDSINEHSDDIIKSFTLLGSIMALIAPNDSKLYGSYYQKILMGPPALPTILLPREEIMDAVRKTLLSKNDKKIGIIGLKSIIGIGGMAGVGKTVLAAALSQEKQVMAAFPDGIFWIPLGRNPNLIAKQSQIINSFNEDSSVISSVEDGKAHLSQNLRAKSCLIILDDVWLLDHIQAFNALGPSSCILITTRNLDILRALGVIEHRLDVLTDSDSLKLLSLWSGQRLDTLPLEAKELVKKCGNLPLTLSKIGAMIKGRPDRWRDILRRLRSGNLDIIMEESPDYPYHDLMKALEVSVEYLGIGYKTKYLELAVFPEDIAIPEGALQMLWNMDRYDAQNLLDLLVDRSLASLEGGKLILHNLQLDFILKLAEDQRSLHSRLLLAYWKRCTDGWSSGPNDGYFFEHLAYHLFQAGKKEDLTALLSDFKWIQAKLLAMDDPTALISDYNYLDQEDLKLIQGAIKLSAHILARDTNQLQGQLIGRLIGFESSIIHSLLGQILSSRSIAWLRPLIPSLAFPSGLLIETLLGHSNWINSLVITPDGRYLVSGSFDGSLKIWDLESGRLVKTLHNHASSVNAIGITRDGKHAVSVSDDRTLKVWELETGQLSKSWQSHIDCVRAVAVTPDGRKVISGSDDRTLKVWDLETSEELLVLQGHISWVRAVAITPDGRRVVSGSEDRTLKVWDLGTGQEQMTLQGHNGSVVTVVVTPDGRKAISGSDDGTLRIWDLETSQELLILEGHDGSINAVIVSPDGRTVLSGSDDGTLIIWDLETGKEIQTFIGHTSSIRSLAVTPDGKRFTSGSEDKTIKIWNLEISPKTNILKWHNSSITAIGVTPNGKKIVSASNDKTLKVWDRKTCQNALILSGHDDWVSAVAITPDGRKIISGSADSSLKIWDLDTGLEYKTFNGHNSWIRAISVTPNGKKVVSGSDDGAIKIWDLETGQEIRSLSGHTESIRSLVVTPDGKKIMTGSDDRTIVIWDLETGNKIQTLRGHLSSVRTLAISSNANIAISGSSDNTIKIWNLKTGNEICTLKGHTGMVNSVTLTAEGNRAVSASNDSSIVVWDLEKESVIAKYIGDDPFTACCVLDKDVIFAGDRMGKLHLLILENTDSDKSRGN